MKKCSKCQISQNLENFSKDKSRHDGLSTKCKACNKNTYLQNREVIIIRSKENRNKNIEKYRNTVRKRYKRKIVEDSVFKLRLKITNRIRESLKVNKSKKSLDIIGCSFDKLKLYLESKFEPWMNWENYGNPKDGLIELNKTWDIDHIKPLSLAKTQEELYGLNHYTNLQPLCSFKNRWVKRDNYEKNNNRLHSHEILV